MYYVTLKRRESKVKLHIYIEAKRTSDEQVEVPTIGKAFELVREQAAELKKEGVMFVLDAIDVRLKVKDEYRVVSGMDWQREGEPVMYELRQDGELVEEGIENMLYMRLQRIQPQSWDYATKHGGWTIKPKEESPDAQ